MLSFSFVSFRAPSLHVTPDIFCFRLVYAGYVISPGYSDVQYIFTPVVSMLAFARESFMAEILLQTPRFGDDDE